MAEHNRSVSVCRYDDGWHLVCYDSGVPVGGEIFPSLLMKEPFYDFSGRLIGQDYGYCCAHLDGRRFVETGELP